MIHSDWVKTSHMTYTIKSNCFTPKLFVTLAQDSSKTESTEIILTNVFVPLCTERLRASVTRFCEILPLWPNFMQIFGNYFWDHFVFGNFFETFQRENCISTNVPCSNGQILIIWSHCWGPTGCLLPSLEPQWPLPRRSLVEWDEPLDRPNGQTRVECGFVWAAAIFEVFNNHNNLLLGWYYCSSPYTKELHGFT